MSLSRLFTACVALALFASPVAGQDPTVELCSTEAIDIVDNTTATGVIDVLDDIEIVEARVSIDISHTWIADIDLSIDSPLATSVMLHSGQGGAADDIILTYTDFGIANGADVYNCACLMQPSGPGTLADFETESTLGEWTLTVADNATGDPGTVNEWCGLFFDTLPIVAVTDLVVLPSATEGIADVTWVNGGDYDEIQVFLNGTLEETLDGPFILGETGSYSTPAQTIPIELEVCLVPLVGTTEGFEACGIVDLDLLPTAETCLAPASDILDLTTLTELMKFGDDITIGETQLRLDITHTFVGDLDITLTSPAGTAVQVHDEGGGGDDDMLVTYGDLGVPHGSLDFTCDCVMQGSPGGLVNFTGESSTGTWTLDIFDNFGADTGVLNEWCVRVFDTIPFFPITDLSINLTDTEGVVEATFSTPIEYDEVEISVDGVVVETLAGPFVAGEVQTYTSDVLDVPNESVEVCVQPFLAGEAGDLACDTTILFELREITVCDSPALAVVGATETFIEITELGFVEDLDVAIEATTGANNWDLVLVSPYGTGLVLDGVGGGGGPGITVVYTDTGVPNGSAPLGPGVFMQAALGGLAETFAGDTTDGEWALQATPTFAGGGTLDTWCLNIDACEVLVPTDVTCELTGADEVSLEWINNDSYDSVELLFDGEILEILDGDAESFTHTEVAAGRHVYRVRGIVDAAGCGFASGPCAASPGVTEFCVAPAQAIAAGAVFESSTLLIKGTDTIEDNLDVFVDVTTDGSVGDWELFVQSPLGTNVVIHDNNLGGNDLLVFFSDAGVPNDGAAGTLDSAIVVQPFGPGTLSDFTGESINGAWTMGIYAISAGTLNEWCLGVIPDCPVVAPSSLTCLVDGLEATLEWTNNDSYDTINVMFDGRLEASLDGDATSYTHAVFAGDHRWQVIALSDAESCRAAAPACLATADLTELCDDVITTVPGGGALTDAIFTVGTAVTIDQLELEIDFSAGVAEAELSSPSGTLITILDAFAGGRVNTIVSDDGDNPLLFSMFTWDCPIAKLPPIGPGTLSDFAGENSDGEWTISAVSAVDTNLDTYCLRIFEACELAAPSISCTIAAGDVVLEWVNEDVYDSIDVLRVAAEDGVFDLDDGGRSADIIGTIDGTMEFFVDDAVPTGHYTYALVVSSASFDCRSLSSSCRAVLGRNDQCDDPVGTIAGGGVTITDFFVNFPSDTNFEVGSLDVILDIVSVDTIMNIDVISPSGTSVRLHEAVDIGADFNVTYSDVGAPNAGAALDCASCLVQPSGPGTLADFEGELADGEWTLSFLSLNDATLNAWCVGAFPAAPTGNTFRRGDASGNGVVSPLLDSLFMLEFAFVMGDAPPCEDAADVDGNGFFSALVDSIALLEYGFNAGEFPPDPGPDGCGVDPDDDDLSCEVSTCTP